MRKSEKNLKSLIRKFGTARACPNPPKKNSNKLGTARACGGTAVPPQPKKNKISFFPLSNNTTSFIFRLFSLNLRNSLQTSPNHKFSKPKQL